MDRKIIILMALLHSMLSMHMDLCCPDSEENKFISPDPNQRSHLELYFVGSPPSVAHSGFPLTLNDDEKCQNSVGCDHSRESTPNGQLWKQVTQFQPKRRTKRFPIHLDPLYQYRYLARSGQCPTAKDGQPEFYCPTSDKQGNWRCIDDFQLCDGVRHCPNGEDELPVSCLFYRVVETHLLSVSDRLNSDEGRQRFPR